MFTLITSDARPQIRFLQQQPASQSNKLNIFYLPHHSYIHSVYLSDIYWSKHRIWSLIFFPLERDLVTEELELIKQYNFLISSLLNISTQYQHYKYNFPENLSPVLVPRPSRVFRSENLLTRTNGGLNRCENL